jgi:hypothetical protein
LIARWVRPYSPVDCHGVTRESRPRNSTIRLQRRQALKLTTLKLGLSRHGIGLFEGTRNLPLFVWVDGAIARQARLRLLVRLHPGGFVTNTLHLFR